jgi:putative peptide zinc metalloprotease protein
MTTTQPQSNASSDRWIGMRTRADLIVQGVTLQGEPCWVVKDPLSMKFYRLQQAEYLVFEALRHKISYRELKQMLVRRFPEQVIRLSSIQQLIVQMQRMGLLVSDAPGQATTLQKEHSKERRKKLVGVVSSLMSPRFPGYDPERLLTFLYGRTQWMFSDGLYRLRTADLRRRFVADRHQSRRILFATSRFPGLLWAGKSGDDVRPPDFHQDLA